MKPEVFQDAMTLLPEELLEPVDALRQKKRFPWRSVLATAACLCLVVGLALGYARIIAPASDSDEAGNMAPPQQENVSQSQAETPSLVEVVQVEADHIFVVTTTCESPEDCMQWAPVRITFEKLSRTPAFEVGQKLLIYWTDEDYDSGNRSISPYRIEIAEE